jgi:hypothetical protein
MKKYETVIMTQNFIVNIYSDDAEAGFKPILLNKFNDFEVDGKLYNGDPLDPSLKSHLENCRLVSLDEARIEAYDLASEIAEFHKWLT